MSKEQNLQRILDSKIVAVIRASDSKQLVEVALALESAEVDTLELTFTIPQAHRVIEHVTNELGSKVLLGAGTVLDSETARIAILSGAEFIVSPTVNTEVIEMCQRYGKLSICGAYTPTEILTAWQAGASIVKIFPADSLGPDYFKAIAGPLPQVRLMPTGGINLDNAAPFLKAGACALGIGGSMVEAAAIKAGDMKRIEQMARKYVAVVKQAGGSN